MKPVTVTSSGARNGVEDRGTDTRAPALWGVVRFEPGEERRVRDTMITFDSAASADLFAIEHGWHDYQVTPLFFFVENVSRQVGGRRQLEAALARAVRRSGPR
ncbi:hypothetical protein [Candidatus Protofrankia californiensis]|uniref:hypothetical protein n=1 Tax=Candidatus Protofrankia californiensis TaxID=1839754 RepID=UPI001F49CF55|nr:hypothetical protein [Candidatus Protofrankia californiensis]